MRLLSWGDCGGFSGTLRAGGGAASSGRRRRRRPRGILADVFFDPPGHARLPIADDEIIDRALAAQCLTGTTVTLLTFDTGQAARARNAGLAVSKLSRPLGSGQNPKIPVRRRHRALR
jgi:hypothetical protein